MKKYTFSIVFGALAAFLVFLAACGEGEPVKLGDSELGQIGANIQELVEEDGTIARCVGNDGSTINGIVCPTIVSRVSSVAESSSSSDNGNTSGSSPSGNGNSSSASNNGGTSSSSTANSGGGTSSTGGNSSSSVPSNVPNATGTVKFDNQDYSSASALYYFIGTVPTISATNIVISNNANAQCTKVKFKITGPSYNKESEEVDVETNGTAILPTYTGDALPSVTTNTSITAEIIATCQIGSRTLATATATLVPDPSLTGTTCTWNTKNDNFGGGKIAKVASTHTMNASYGRCDDAPSFFVSSVKKSLVSAGLLVDSYTSSNQTMTGITIGAACSNSSYSITPISCPNINVKNPATMCGYSTANVCGDIPITKVKVGKDFGKWDGNRASEPQSCTYVLSIAMLRIGSLESGTDKGLFINGKKTSSSNSSSAGGCATNADGLTECATFLSSVDKIDGGYYVYINSNSAHDNGITIGEATELDTNCRD